ncbi:MAG: hypothetical protein HZB42_07795 [Sphingobacteriales bacterium]|nr:hypothetical protein [Sphingobacteriales bacterium]
MKYFFKNINDSAKPELQDKANHLSNKLYVAYINRDMANDDGLYEEAVAGSSRYKASSFTSDGGQTPVILSQEEEMMLFSDEYY